MSSKKRILEILRFRGRGLLIVSCLAGVILAVAALLVTMEYRQSATSPQSAFSQKVSTKSALRLQFPELMNHESVEQYILIPADVQGDLRWEEETLAFYPSAQLDKDERYVFVVDRKAERADGTQLGKDLQFTFIISGEPTVAAHVPGSGSTNINKKTAISIVFDRPMVPLTQVQGEAKEKMMSDLPFTVSPAPEGRWRWLSTYAITFEPKDGLTLGTKYIVTVPAGLKTAMDDIMKEGVTWSFETERPNLLSMQPSQDSSLAGPTSVVELTFNQEIDLESAKSSVTLFSITATGAVPPSIPTQQRKKMEKESKDIFLESAVLPSTGRTAVPIKEIKYGTKIVDGKKITDRTTLIVVPERLELKSTYAAQIASGLKGIEGDLGTKEDFVLRFSTVGALSVLRATYEGGGIQLSFSNPMDEESLKKNIVMDPKPQGWDDLRITLNMWGDKREANLYPQLQPSTKYTVTIQSTINDEFDQHLASPHIFSFTTDPLQPQISVISKGEFGIFERGKPPVYYIDATNVKTVNVELAPMPLDDFIALRRKRMSDYNARPNLETMPGFSTWARQTKGKLNTKEVLTVDIEKEASEQLRSGVYALSLWSPEYFNPMTKAPIQDYQYFALTNIALTLKFSGDHALVWAIDMRSGKPIPDASIAFRSLQGTVPVQGKTDANGFFETKLNLKDFSVQEYDWQPEFYLTAQKDDDFAFLGSRWNEGMSPWNFGVSENFLGVTSPEMRLVAYLYTDRPIYAAGDTVYFKGIVRFRDRNGVLQVPSQSINPNVTITDAEGRSLLKVPATLSKFGSFTGSLVLAREASLGTYSLSVQMPPNAKTGEMGAGTSFSVLAYRKPEYKIDLTPSKEDYVNKESIDVKLDASYYFGAPMAGAPVAWRAQSTDYFFNRYTDGWYSFSADDAWCFEDCKPETKSITEGKAKLNDAGQLSISFPVNIDDRKLSQVATIEADVTDPNNQVVSNRASVMIHKANAYVGIRATEYVFSPGDEVEVELVTVRPDGAAFGEQNVKVDLYSRTWTTIRKKGVDGEYYFENQPKDTFVATTSVTSDTKGKVQAKFKPNKGGEYRIIAEVKDEKGLTAKAGTSVYVSSSTYVNWPHSNSDRIPVETNLPRYSVGDTARILVKSPYQGTGVKALVTVERENVLTKRIIDITSNAQLIEIPITDNLVPTAYVSVIVIKPRIGETFDEQGRDTGAPSMKIGYAKLNIDTDKKELSVNVRTDKDKFLPGETVNVRIETKDANGKPVSAEVSLAAVDMSLLALAGFRQPSIVDSFYNEQGLGVITSQTLRYLVERFKPGSKGGGGGDFEARKRGLFKDTAYWNPTIVTNEQGQATVSFALPDNLTTWKLLAIGHTRNHTFGVGDKDIIETKRVIVRPVRPRFAVRGDEIEIGAIVHNFLENEAKFTVALSGSGFEAIGPKSQSISVKQEQNTKLIFPVRITGGNKALFRFSAETNGAKDEVEESIPVFTFGVEQTVATAGSTEEGTTERVLVPSANDAKEGTLKVVLAPTLATYLPSGLQYVVSYPYSCAEQIVSSFFPVLAVKQLQNFEAFSVVSNSELDKHVSTSLQKLYELQRGDGGFGFWKGSEKSDPYLTAYVVHALSTAKDVGSTVDANVIRRATEYLGGILRSQDITRTLDRTTRTYILYVLSETGKGDLALLNALYEKREGLPLFAKAQLAMALQKQGGKRAKDLLGEILDSAKVDARGAHFEEKKAQLFSSVMHTNTRTTALVLQAVLRVDPKNPLLPNIVRYLLTSRKDGHWDTTQSTTFSIFALSDYLRSTGEMNADFIAVANVDGKELLSGTFNKSNLLTKREASLPLSSLDRGKLTDVQIGKNGVGKLYYDLLLSYFYTPESLPAAEEGMSITRTISPVTDTETAGDDAVNVGSTYKVTLTITTPEDRRFIAVESPLPAGMELVDFRLNTSQKTLLENVIAPKNFYDVLSPMLPVNHEEFRDDEVFLATEFLPAGVYTYEYLVRATVPGKFRTRPAKVWEMYFPETFGQSAGGWFTVHGS